MPSIRGGSDSPVDPAADTAFSTDAAPSDAAIPVPTDTPETVVASDVVPSPDVENTPAEDAKDTANLRLVSAFGAGDTFSYPDGEDIFTVGTQPTPVPTDKADAIIASAASAGLQVENLSAKADDDTSKEG